MRSDQFRVVIRPQADAEIAEAALWYESQEPGLGQEFLRSFRSASVMLQRNPYLYQEVAKETRRVLMRRFPYSIFYEVRDQDIIILACFHTGRNPQKWQERVE